MPVIIFIEHDGNQHEVEAQTDLSVMNAAISNGVPGIDADCGGACSCATCHVFVDEVWREKVGAPGEYEEPMLDMSPFREAGSRLSCQINVTEELDGLVVRLPQFQY
jgi:2Fe-2S ferredoxin